MKRHCLAGLVAAGVLMSGCSEEAGKKKAEERATALQAGEYEVSLTVDSVRSTDKSSPASRLKQGAAPAVARTCVGPDNQVPAAAFVEAGDSCTDGDNYMRNGRMSLQFRCKRAGKGDVMHSVDGNFTKDGFEGEVLSTSSFSGTGDYEARQKVKAKRVGDCAAKAA